MKLSNFKFLTDENIQSAVVQYLKGLQIDILDVRESGLNGSSDSSLLHLAFTQQRAVLTHDSDFGTLSIANQQPIFAIIYLKPGHIQPQFSIDSLNAILEMEDLNTPLIITVKNNTKNIKVRIRHLNVAHNKIG